MLENNKLIIYWHKHSTKCAFFFTGFILFAMCIPIHFKDLTYAKTCLWVHFTKQTLCFYRFSAPDKIKHIGAFCIFYILWNRVFQGQKYAQMRALCLGVIFSIFLEALQYLLPYRTGSSWDLSANAIGLTIGILIIEFQTIKNK